MKWLLIGLVLASVGCAPRCQVRTVPVTWADGTQTTWDLTICRSTK